MHSIENNTVLKVDTFIPSGVTDKLSTGGASYFNKMVRTHISKASGIYKIKSKINGKFYIGSSIDLKYRKQGHFKDLQNRKHGNKHLQRHVNKYGLDDLKFSIIEFCEKENNIKREQYWMDTLKPEFNICPTAGSNLGRIFSEEHRRKIGKIHKGKKLSDETKQKMSKHSKGIFHTDKTKKKISEAHKGKKLSDETKQKMSTARKGVSPSNKGKKGFKHTEETKKKMSIAKKGKKQSDEHIRKLKISRKKHLTQGN